MTAPHTLLNAWQIKAKKQLGQNFLRRAEVTEKIVTAARLKPDDTVVEIGAGLGALTIPAARKAGWIYAVETDRRIAGLLKTEILTAGLDNVDIIEADILNLDLKSLSTGSDSGLVVIGNLPYNISSQILIKLIAARRLIQRAVLMFQKELAERLMASPGIKAYGRITVMLAYCATVNRLADISADAFFPQPRIDSTILEVRFRRTLDTPLRDEAFFYQVVKAAFSQRRKTLKNALAGSFLDLSPQIARDALASAGIDPVRRAETLSVAEFVRLSDCLMPVSPQAL